MLSKRRFWLVLVFVVLALVAVWYWLSQTGSTAKDSVLVFDPVSGEWARVKAEPRVDIEELDPHPNDDGLHNRTLVRGYFDSYNEANNEITIKAVLPFTGDTQYELVKLKLPLLKTTYCAPASVVDQRTGELLLTQEMGFIVKDGQEMITVNEQLIPFEEFLAKASDTTYLLIQLASDFDRHADNYITKLVVVGLCD